MAYTFENSTRPKDAEYAREIIAEQEAHGRKPEEIAHFAKLVLKVGNYTDDGLSVWHEYLEGK